MTMTLYSSFRCAVASICRIHLWSCPGRRDTCETPQTGSARPPRHPWRVQTGSSRAVASTSSSSVARPIATPRSIRTDTSRRARRERAKSGDNCVPPRFAGARDSGGRIVARACDCTDCTWNGPRVARAMLDSTVDRTGTGCRRRRNCRTLAAWWG